MTAEELNGFSALWEEFVRQLKKAYIGILTPELVKKDGTFRGELSKLYSRIGWEYWRGNDGAAVRWLQRYGERFFENRHYPLQKMLYNFKDLDALAEQSLKQERQTVKHLPPQAEKLYTLMIEPHLNSRKQAVLGTISDLKRELMAPVSYKLTLPLQTPLEVSLTFSSCYQKEHSYTNLETYAYSFYGRAYQGIETLWKETLEDLSEDVFIGQDAYGEKVLKIYTGIPTFDSGDREWDSRILEYLIYDGKTIDLVVMHGGYNIADLTFYEKLLTADSRMKPIFDQLGWPQNDIEWI